MGKKKVISTDFSFDALVELCQRTHKVPSIPLNWQAVSVELLGRFNLSWSHFVALLSIDNPKERQFYEIEAKKCNWGGRDLERQIARGLG